MRLAGVAYSNIERYNIIFAVPAELCKARSNRRNGLKKRRRTDGGEIKTCAEAQSAFAAEKL
jgi:hypothetical protein